MSRKMESKKSKKSPPKLQEKNKKTKSRLFRFTESNYDQMKTLSKRYNANVSKVMDLLVEVSKIPECVDLMDSYVEQLNSA